MASASTAPQPSEITGEAEPAVSDGVAESGYVETPFGAPVVRELPPGSTPWARAKSAADFELGSAHWAVRASARGVLTFEIAAIAQPPSSVRRLPRVPR